MTLEGLVESVNISRGGVPKTRVAETLITFAGLDGDHQWDTRFHGGPDRAVVLYSLEVIQALRLEGHPIAVGSTGENLTISGLDWTSIVPGLELAVGAARVLVTKFASPCETIRRSFLDDDFSRVSHQRSPGWSRVCGRVLASSCDARVITRVTG